jgi:hypothetical protein
VVLELLSSAVEDLAAFLYSASDDQVCTMLLPGINNSEADANDQLIFSSRRELWRAWRGLDDADAECGPFTNSSPVFRLVHCDPWISCGFAYLPVIVDVELRHQTLVSK